MTQANWIGNLNLYWRVLNTHTDTHIHFFLADITARPSADPLPQNMSPLWMKQKENHS